MLNINVHYSQIVIDNNAPYHDVNWLVNNILLGGGVTATNHSYDGDSVQIGWFNAVNTGLGIDSGIVLASGEIALLDPTSTPTFPILPNTATDPDLLTVANSVPPLLPAPFTNSFTVNGIYDVAKLEFDFIPTSDTIKFNYVFGSQEYFGFENSNYNDVFGFFLSGPGIAGPYTSPAIHPNGAINLAVVPNSNPPLPITISSINSVTPINQQYFVDNQSGLDTIADADGLTTVLTATAVVQCGETYHIRLSIADGSDASLNSYVWLEAGSFSSPTLNIVDNLGIDSTFMQIPCNSSITLTADGGQGATYQWFDENNNTIATDSFVTVGGGIYLVEASSFGCPVISDTLKVIEDPSPSFDFGLDVQIPCNTTILLDPQVTGGVEPYSYIWSTGSSESVLNVDEGFYVLTVNDVFGCSDTDTIVVTEDPNPTTSISGGGILCADGTMANILFDYDGVLPWDLVFSDGSNSYNIDNIMSSTYTHTTFVAGQYTIDSSTDVNGCISNTSGSVDIIVNPLPEPVISTDNITIYIGDYVILELVEEYVNYEWYQIGNESVLNESSSITVTDTGTFYVWVEDVNGCTNLSDIAVVNTIPITQLYVPTTFTPNNDDHNELFVIQGINIVDFSIQIYSRWGQKVFESNTIDKSWDGYHEGKRIAEGSYYYHIEVLGEDDEIFEKTGEINVMY